MNKTLVGELQSLIAHAEAAQGEKDFYTFEQHIIGLAQSYIKIIHETNKARPGEKTIIKQMEDASFRTKVRI